TVARVVIIRAGPEEQRIVLEDRESFRHGREAIATQEFVAAIMADAGGVSCDLSRRDRPALLRERRHVTLHGHVEIDASTPDHTISPSTSTATDMPGIACSSISA